MLISQSPGRTKENSLGGTGASLPLVTSWLVRKSTVLEQSPTAVSPNWTREWDSSKGGWTPVPRQDSRKSLVEKKKLFRYTVALDLTMWTRIGITFFIFNLPFPFHARETINKTSGEPVKFWLAGELETVVFIHSGTEDQVKPQCFLREQSSKSIIGLDVYTLQKAT